ncbi:MAG: SH3 domain-containing protein [Myxococcota bacterium]|nr:SH3 domain-containing protein [Myxococcota bacterium]
MRVQAAACALALFGSLACATDGAEPPAERQPVAGRCDDRAVYRSAARARVDRLERQVAQLRADLQQAEASMVAIESGLRGVHNRADAVSAVAEARIAVDRAARAHRWRPDQVQEARDKLAEAEIQLESGHTGSTVFFATRAHRIAEGLNDEAEQVARTASTRFVKTRRANLRAGPSMDEPVVETLSADSPVFPERESGDWVLVRTLAGPAGWVHASLLSPR